MRTETGSAVRDILLCKKCYTSHEKRHTTEHVEVSGERFAVIPNHYKSPDARSSTNEWDLEPEILSL